MLSVGKLSTLSAAGGVFCVFFAKWVTKKIETKYEKEPYCQESLKMLKNHEGANFILGKGFEIKVVYIIQSHRMHFIIKRWFQVYTSYQGVKPEVDEEEIRFNFRVKRFV